MKNNKKITKKEDRIVTQDKINNFKKKLCDPEIFCFQEDEKIDNYLVKKHKMSDEEKNNIGQELLQMNGLKNGYWISRISYSQNISSLSKMKKEFIEENECKSSIELMLADKIVANYWRVMKYEQVFNRFIENDEGKMSFNQLTVNIFKEINRGLEIAHRQLDNNIILFKELKQPNLKLTVKTDNAYFAENQQVINNTKNSEKLEDNNEIIKG